MSAIGNPADPERREFCRTAAFAAAAGRFGLVDGAAAGSNSQPAASFVPRGSLPALSRVEAGLLEVGFAEYGRKDGPPAILLHGWPYDIHSYEEVAPLLGSAGLRVIVPYVRGYGTTRFLSAETFRNGQQAALAVDTIALMDALKIDRAILAGCDWGARTACIVAALWPERCTGLVSVSGYLIGSRETNRMPLPPSAEYQWWYQYYFATERGREGYERYRRDFARLIWKLASPLWRFDDTLFQRSAASFDNPDHVAVVIHNYRWRLGLAEGESRYDGIERRLAAGIPIAIPTITLEGDANGAPHPEHPPIEEGSSGNTSTAPSKAGSGTIFHRRRRPRSPRQSWMLLRAKCCPIRQKE